MNQKKVIIVLAAFLAVLKINAQATFKPGLRAGLSLSTISETHSDYKPDFYIGGLGEINFNKHYALQPEITYSRQGSNNVERNFYDPTTQTDKVVREDLNLDYLSISLINKFTFGPGFQIQFGPAVDIAINDNLMFRKSSNDLSFITGLAYRMPSSGLTFEVRFKQGLLDVLDSGYYHNSSNEHYFFGDYNTNNNFQFGVSYIFGK